MIFGSKPVYIFAKYNKKKLHSLGRTYPFEKLPVVVDYAPLKLINEKAEIFYKNIIFNSYLVSEEEKVFIMNSFDEKYTFIKKGDMCYDFDKLYTVKIIEENEKTREVEIFKFDEPFPGAIAQGRLEIQNKKVYVNTEYGRGEIILQNNSQAKDVECQLVKIEEGSLTFAQINAPVRRCTVKVIKDLKSNKIVENDNVRGILLDAQQYKVGEEVCVYTKEIYPGSYVFVEDISPGIYNVSLMEKKDGFWLVRYKEFVGECFDKKVSKVMKGHISDIRDDRFLFKRIEEENEASKRTGSFEEVEVLKKVKIESEDDIKKDQFKAINFIKNLIVEEGYKEKTVKELFYKYSKICSENDHLCFYFMSVLNKNETLTEKEISKIIKEGGKKLPVIIAEECSDLKILKSVLKCVKAPSVFKKVIELEGKEAAETIKAFPEFKHISISHIYKVFDSPRKLVEEVLKNTYEIGIWKEYLKNETGEYKRNIFKRLTKMKFKKNNMKEIFKLWVEFEESEGGDVEAVHKAAKAFIEGN